MFSLVLLLPSSCLYHSVRIYNSNVQQVSSGFKLMHFHLCLRIILIALLCFTSGFSLLVGGWSPRGVTMTGIVKSLWQRFTGGYGQDQATGGGFKDTMPDTLEGFGYQFTKDGELLDKNGGRFQFVIRKDDHEYNQRRYVALGELVTEYLYRVMERDLKLEKVYIPVDAKKEEAQSFIFRTKDAGQNKNLMVLIHGSGAVRAGQWSRKLIINENIDTGSQLPYIRGAIADGFAVIVMNPNLNEVPVNGRLLKVKGSESPEQHGVYVWRHFVEPAKAQNIAMVAHSYGGIVAFTIAETFLMDFKRRVFSVVFTDSVHTDRQQLWSKAVKDFMKQRAVNFVSAMEPLNFKMKSSYPDDCLTVSAGTTEHERTSHSCIKSAFQFMRTNYDSWVKNGSVDPNQFFSVVGKIKSEL